MATFASQWLGRTLLGGGLSLRTVAEAANLPWIQGRSSPDSGLHPQAGLTHRLTSTSRISSIGLCLWLRRMTPSEPLVPVVRLPSPLE